MVEKVNVEIIKTIEKYIAEISKYYKIDFAILFGSYAKGTAHKDSDIDIAVVSDDIKNEFNETLNLMRFRRKIDLRIEPHPIQTEDYKKRATPFIDEIINTGIPIYSAI